MAVLPKKHVIALAASFMLVAFGQQVSIEPRRKPPAKEEKSELEARVPSLRVDTSLVLVPVTVTDRLDRPVMGLEKENFRIFEDGVQQAITRFAMDDDSLAVGFVFDTSGSMAQTIRGARMAAQQFFTTAEPGDEYCLVTFDTVPRLLAKLTSEPGTIQEQLMFTKSGGSTALLDAVFMGVNELKKSKKPKKALVLISDGVENHSRYTISEVVNLLRESDVLIYTIGPPVDTEGGPLMKLLAEQTGGRLVEWDRDLPDLAKKIILDLRNRYVLGYSPHDQPRDGKFHSIQVQVLPPKGLGKLHAHWRNGYYAPY